MKSVESIYLIGGIAYRGWSKKDVDIWIVTNGNTNFENDPTDKLKSFYKLDAVKGIEVTGFLFNGWVLDLWYGNKEELNKPNILLRGK
jgi:predicted nucleotidyltransferase